MHRKTILLVEDNVDSRIIFSTILKRAGYRVLEAADAIVAEQMLAIEQVDLVLLDIELPDVDGWEFASRLRSAARTSGLPIIAVTALDDAHSRARAHDLGFIDYLCKPVEPFRLAETVDRVVAA